MWFRPHPGLQDSWPAPASLHTASPGPERSPISVCPTPPLRATWLGCPCWGGLRTVGVAPGRLSLPPASVFTSAMWVPRAEAAVGAVRRGGEALWTGGVCILERPTVSESPGQLPGCGRGREPEGDVCGVSAGPGGGDRGHMRRRAPRGAPNPRAFVITVVIAVHLRETSREPEPGEEGRMERVG